MIAPGRHQFKLGRIQYKSSHIHRLLNFIIEKRIILAQNPGLRVFPSDGYLILGLYHCLLLRLLAFTRDLSSLLQYFDKFAHSLRAQCRFTFLCIFSFTSIIYLPFGLHNFLSWATVIKIGPLSSRIQFCPKSPKKRHLD